MKVLKMSEKTLKGYSLVWAVGISFVLMILIIAVFTLSSSYSDYSVKKHSERQALYTAKSAADITAKSKRIEIDGTFVIDFGKYSDNMGTCSVTVTHISENIYIKAEAEYCGVSRTVTAEISENGKLIYSDGD